MNIHTSTFLHFHIQLHYLFKTQPYSTYHISIISLSIFTMPTAVKHKLFHTSTSDIRDWEYRRIRMIILLSSIPIGDAPIYLEEARSLLTKGTSTYDGLIVNRRLYENAWTEYLRIQPRPKYDRKYVKRMAVLGYGLSLPNTDWKKHASDGTHIPWLERLESLRKSFTSERDLLSFSAPKRIKKPRSPKQLAYYASLRDKTFVIQKKSKAQSSPATAEELHEIHSFNEAVDNAAASFEAMMNMAMGNFVPDERCG
jgi:hypothetical protein